MIKKNAIVLRNISQYKLALLDEKRGRLDGIVLKTPLVGSFLDYEIKQEREMNVFIQHYTVKDLPFGIARLDLLFWHHILELCYYFVPVGMYVPELFELLMFLYTVERGCRWDIQAKKVYLFKVLSLIGIQTEFPHVSPAKRDYFISFPLTSISEVVLDQESKKILDEWLRVCVSEHPAIEQFKTMHFLGSE